MQPSYCFRGATATHRRLISRIRTDARIPSRLAAIHVPFCLHTGIRFSEPHTRALLLPSLLDLSATGCREAISDFTIPTLSTRLAASFLGRGRLLPPSGFGSYHQTLFKGTDGRTSRMRRSAAELAWMVPKSRRSCNRVAPIHASFEGSRAIKDVNIFDPITKCYHLAYP
jgi:hypothetical protein